MLIMNGKNHVIFHMLLLRIFGTPKKLRFLQNCEEMPNQLNSANWAKLHKSHIQESVNGQSSTNNSTRLIWRDARCKQKKSHDRSHDDTMDIWRSKKLCFWKNHEEVFNWLNSVSWINGDSHVRWSHKVIVKMGITKMTEGQKKWWGER